MDQFTNQRIIQQQSSSGMPPHQSPNYNFYPQQQQTFTAGHMRPEFGGMRPDMSYNQHDHFPCPNFYPHSGPFPHPRPALYPQDMHQAAIQRDIEKQKIREEIMRDEARRRELEAEVMKELMEERKLALRTGDPSVSSPAGMWLTSPTSGLVRSGSPSEDSVALSVEERMRRGNTGLEMMPFQRANNANLRISEVEPARERGEKKQIIILAKPDTYTSGSKRKAEDSSSEPLPALIFTKKAKEEWNCALCKIRATSELGLNEHLGGKKHKSKEAASRTSRNGKNYVIGLLSDSTTRSPQVASEQLKSKPEVAVKVQENGVQEEKKYRHWCEICQVGTHSKKVMKDHMGGKNHTRRSRNILKIDAEEAGAGSEHDAEEDGAGSEHQGAEDHLV